MDGEERNRGWKEIGRTVASCKTDRWLPPSGSRPGILFAPRSSRCRRRERLALDALRGDCICFWSANTWSRKRIVGNHEGEGVKRGLLQISTPSRLEIAREGRARGVPFAIVIVFVPAGCGVVEGGEDAAVGADHAPFLCV